VKRILLDTNLYVAFKLGEDDAVELLRLADEVHLSAVVLGELLVGFRLGKREKWNREELSRFLDAPRVRVLEVDSGTAEHYSRVFALLRAKGRPIPTNDLWIAATALQHGLLLATRDNHFSAIEGLATVSHPSQLLP
jgi:tRNA(fMet)-specific endonuclease VapC